MSKVLLDWMGSLTWKQQSVILSALRGPDNLYSPNIKKITKWLRIVTQNNADLSSSYMMQEKLPSIELIEREFEFTTIHYTNHFLQALEIIGYKHPNKNISNISKKYYTGLVINALNLNPETESQLEKRLKDLK